MVKKRTYGTGSIFLRGKYYYLQSCTNGKTKLTSLRTSNLETAEKEAARLNREMLNPIADAKTQEDIARYIEKARHIRKAASIKIADAFSLYLKSEDRPDSGARQLNDYKAQWERFKKYLDSLSPGRYVMLSDIDKDAANGFAKYLAGLGICARTFNKGIAAVALVVRTLAEEAGLDNNPFETIRKKKHDTIHKKELTEEEALRLLATFNDPDFDIPFKDEMKLCFHVGIFTGLRFSDAVNLRFDQLALVEGLIKLKPSKTKRTSGIVITIPVHPLLKEMLFDAEAKRVEGQEYVMPRLATRFLTHKIDLNRDMIRVFEFAKFKPRLESKDRLRSANVYGFHSFRSTFCSFAARKGVPLSVLAQITGDNIQTLQKYYVRIDDKTAAQTVAALPMMQSPTSLPSPVDGLEALRTKAKALIDGADAKAIEAAIAVIMTSREA